MTVSSVVKNMRKTNTNAQLLGKCKKCGKENHFAAKCRSRVETSWKSKPVHVVSEQDSDTYEDIMTITEVNRENEAANQVKESHSQNQQLFAGMMMDKKLVNFQIDCGATCNIIPLNLLNPNTATAHRKSAGNV